MIGVGAMLHILGGGSENSAEKYYGREIRSAKIEDDELKIAFSDGTRIRILDDGQSCCEHRYMTTDDDPSSLVGQKLVRIETKPAADVEGDYDVHETVFVEIGTDQGFISIVNHNEHNGYYGGFGLTIREETDTENFNEGF